MKEIQAEIDAKRSRMKVLLKEHVDSTQDDEGNSTYFLNNLPPELLVTEIPSGRSSSWTDGSNLTARERPDVGIDLS